MRRRGGKLGPDQPVETAAVHDMTAAGAGVVRGAGKTVFVDGAVTGETVRFRRRRRRKGHDEADLVEVLEPSPDRVTPACQHFGYCGGCSLQHLGHAAQLRLKQQMLADSLQRIGSVTPERWIAPVTGPAWGYRRKARLAVKYVAAKGRTLVGFRERDAPYVADLRRCETLVPSVGTGIEALAELVDGLSIRARLPQIEVAAGDDALALVFRVLDPPSPADLDALARFQAHHRVRIFLQDGGPDSVRPLSPDASGLLHYDLPEQGLRLAFEPLDFVQVNAAVNARMVGRAIELLQITGDSEVLDLYCGLGNFSLPLAQRARSVLGVEGEARMVERGQANARAAGLHNVSFSVADLAADGALDFLHGQRFGHALLDPPRAGALAVIPALGRLGVSRLVYVSCHPGTLARDAGALVREHGYRLEAAGIMDMFPQTSHVESMAVFSRD